MSVRVMSEYELRRYIEADEIKMRQLGHTPDSLRASVAAGVACWDHELPTWQSYRSHVWLLTGEAL